MKHVLSILILLVLFAGFFAVLQKLSDIEITLQNGSHLSATSTPGLPEIIVETPTSTNAENSGIVNIPTAIIFRTPSSARLQPQTNIAVILESVSKDAEGNVLVNFKAFTSEATAYSGLEVQNIFEIVNLSTGGNLRPTDIVGQFNSIAPKSASSGTTKFRVSPAQRSIILQINTGENPMFYRFYFDEKRYEETTLG